MKIYSVLGFQFYWASRIGWDIFNSKLAHLDINVLEANILLLLNDAAPMVQGHMANLLMVEKSTISYSMTKLEKLELIHRYPHPTDRRALMVNLLPKGQELLQQIGIAAHTAEEELLQRLSTDDRAKLLELMQRVTTAPAPILLNNR